MIYSLLSASDSSVPASQVLNAAEDFVKAALDALTTHIAILDENGVIIHVNRAWQRFGDENGFRTPDYGIGVNYLDVCDRSATTAPDAALMAAGIRNVRLRQTETFHMEYPCHSSSEKRWFLVRVSRFSWYGSDRIIVSHQNISDMKRTQAMLEDSNRWLEAVLDNLVDGILTFDESGTITSLNRAGAYIFGYDQPEIVGQNIRKLIPSFPDEGRDMSLAKLLEPFSGLGDELEGMRQDGATFPMYFAVSQIILNQQRRYTAIVQDLTERKFLESQVWDKERLNRALEHEREMRDMKNRFISMMSHDLKTPLAAIRLANSMLRNYGDRLEPNEKVESYETIDQQVEYLTELINDVMQISRADFTGAELNLEVVDLETYCRDIIEELQLAYRDKRKFRFKGTDRRIESQIDRKLMRRAITNLLTNAVKYSPNGAPVSVTLAYTDCQAILSISDKGIGIPEVDLPRLFEPFNRASNVGTIQGTGLGLVIAKQAVELHGGQIEVHSKVGTGTTFTITLAAEGC